MPRRDEWFKSSRSSGIDAKCVEVCFRDGVEVRDSKDPGGPQLTVSPEVWQDFIASVMSHDALDAVDDAQTDKAPIRAEWNTHLPGATWFGVRGHLEFALVVYRDATTFAVVRQDEHGPRLLFTSAEWVTFVSGVRDGEFIYPR
ncbi:DUF397 domain-containing protein [Amycolatopsis sp. H20-H5]|uniref:DUF397 domain-containing protein n=1 Tax=Amycolatopsis sp. H20-H5 TaxID=3046309 RepID=UPI002DC0155E|nr:DUF397 domain-containing protein [Amycolatopsis sp. H20-H5]MEC3977189.1 DUF397 domain-containing protein [Amycolatopsis sp. H20-H5]